VGKERGRRSSVNVNTSALSVVEGAVIRTRRSEDDNEEAGDGEDGDEDLWPESSGKGRNYGYY
jgi:hypothetical protein